MKTDNRPPRMRIVWDVLESARNNNDAIVIEACNRMIVANRLGRRHDPSDNELVLAFAE